MKIAQRFNMSSGPQGPLLLKRHHWLLFESHQLRNMYFQIG